MKKEQLSQIIKSARDIMRKDDNLSTDLDRIPQLSWLLFLKCFDDLEERRRLLDKNHKDTIDVPYRWRDWAADENKGKTGEDLVKFVNDELFPYLRGLVGKEQNDSRDVIAALFKETYNRMRSGYLLRDLVNLVNKINFNLKDDVHTMAHFYESMLKEMRDAAGTNGEFYTPRPVIRFIVEQVNPQLGETVYDPAAGTCGFLVETYQHMMNQVKSAEDLEKLRYQTLFGTEKKPMPFLLGMMNLLLHDIDNPNLVRGNTLSTPIKEITDKQRHETIITNPPFGGEEERGILDNFPLETRTAETTLLFIQFIMRSLKINGRCGIVVPNGFLFGDGVAAKIKKELLENFNLHTIVRLPNGVFAPYTGIPTNLLFFEKTGATKDIWFYELQIPDGRKTYTKTNSLRYEEFEECAKLWKTREKTEHSWIVKARDIAENNYNLDIKNPSAKNDIEHRKPEELVESVIENEKRIFEIMQEIRAHVGKGWTDGK